MSKGDELALKAAPLRMGVDTDALDISQREKIEGEWGGGWLKTKRGGDAMQCDAMRSDAVRRLSEEQASND
jgi:hypothetical protein